jgi:hypothetical protein
MMNGSFFPHEPFAFLRFLGEDVALESFLECDLSGAGDLKSFLGTRICFNLWHLMMRFYMIPCWRICTGRSLGGPFGQSGSFPLPGSPAIKNGARSYVFFGKMGIIS